MSSNGDDELERRLRDVLSSRGLGVPVSPDAINRIHAGARRRQQRRSAASALGAVAIIAIAAIVIGVRTHGHGSTVAANTNSPSPSAAVSSSLPASPSVGPSPSVSPSPTVSASAVVVPTPVVSPPETSTAASFQPLSVSAVGPNVYWVLGSAPCAAGQCAALEYTTDGGATFTRIGHNAASGEMPPVPMTVEDGTTVRDVRFGDTQNGWLYGGAFYATHDGGSTWAPDSSLPNDVVDVAAASGHVWAVALSAQNGSESYGLYHATYGSSGTGTWTKVPLGASIIAQPGLGVVKQTAFLLAQVANGQGEIFVIAGDGKSLVSHPAPCASSGNTVSVAGDSALWIRCSGSNTISVFASNDQAAHWQAVTAASAAVSVGGVDATHAVIESTDGLHLISTAGDSATVSYAPGATQSLPGFIGFTTTKLGFIVTDGTGAQLWRTTDGGLTWSIVHV
jgi:photosystem II stability/assembly factor-like uncharacterized protein